MDNSLVVQNCPRTLCAAVNLCEKDDCEFHIDRGGVGSRFPRDGETLIECEKEGDLLTFPLTIGDTTHSMLAISETDRTLYTTTEWENEERDMCIECSEVMTMVATVAGGSREMAFISQHLLDGHRHFDPKCIWCVRAGLRKKKAVRSSTGNVEKEGLCVSWDYSGPHTPDVDGFKWAGVGVEITSSSGHVSLQENKTAQSTLTGIQQFEAELLQLAPKGSRVAELHTDDDKSFRGAVEKYADSKGIKQTHTGGYNPNNNARVERRIGQPNQMFRVLLLYSTGGLYYYEQLWGRGLYYANCLLNWLPWNDRDAPYATLKQQEYTAPSDRHVFGA